MMRIRKEFTPFQFHIGSIQRGLVQVLNILIFGVSIPHWFDSKHKELQRQGYYEHRFNSTLVRFKALLCMCLAVILSRFNSTLVRFKARFCSRKCICTFNVSIPHWFDSKPLFSMHRWQTVSGFQFHIGSIQSLFLAKVRGALTSFQFHIGSIQSFLDKLRKDAYKYVSIPHWFDSKTYPACRKRSRESVSIPHWFDSKSDVTINFHQSIHSFNSTLVRFKVACRSKDKLTFHGFNSTLVRFKDHHRSLA